MTSSKMSTLGQLTRLFVVWLCVVCVRCGGNSCPGECDCAGKFQCELLSHWPVIPEIGDPNSVTKLQLTCVGEGSLGSLSGIEQFISLTSVTIKECDNVSAIPEGVFAHAPKLTSVDLTHNGIRDVHANGFVGLDLLETLTLDNNDITELPPGTFHSLPRLKHLTAKGNKIASLATDMFTNNRELVDIDLSTNHLSKIETDQFARLTQLQSLTLTSNGIQTLAPGCFNTASLREIVLTSNAIDYIDESMFHGNLQKLYASHNRITGVPEALLRKLQALSELHLDGNRFHCNCEILALVSVIKKNTAAADKYKCTTPFTAKFVDLDETNAKCRAPEVEPIIWDDAGNRAVCRGSGDPAPTITWTVSGSDTPLVTILPAHNKEVLQTEAALDRSAWRDGSTHVCNASTAYGQQYATFYWRVDTDVRKPEPTAGPSGQFSLIVIIGAVGATFLVTLLVTAAVTVCLVKRRNKPARNSSQAGKLEMEPRRTGNSYTDKPAVLPTLPQQASMLNDNSSRRNGETRRRENRRSKPAGASQSADSDTEGIYLGLDDTARELDVHPVYTGVPGRNSQPMTESVYEGLDEHKRQPTTDPVYTGRSGRNSQPTTETVYEGLDEHKRQPTTDPVYTGLPNKQPEEATITFNED